MVRRGQNKSLNIFLWCVALILGVVGTAVAKLTYPGTPSKAHSVVFDGYINLPKGKTLSVLDYITDSGEGLFVTNESNGSVYKVVVDKSGHPGQADVSELAGEGATHGVVIDPATKLAYVSRSETNTVDVFDPIRLQVVKHIPVADDPDGIFFDPVNKFIYVVSGDSKLGTLINPVSQSTIATIPLGGKPEFAAFDRQAKLFYQNVDEPDAVVAVDLAKQQVVQRWPLATCVHPSAMAIDESNRRLFIACSGNAKVVVLNLDTHQVITAVNVGGQPDSMAFDAELHRIYVTGKPGVLSVVKQNSPDAYQVVDSIQTHYGAHTLALDSATHQLYLGYASLFVEPRIAVFSPTH